MNFLKKIFSPKPKSFYQQLGGERALRSLVREFYIVMDTDPQALECRALHAKSLQQAEEKLFLFLSGWLGGPPLFEQKYGHPRLRMRHFPFAIGERERDQWLYCMEQALERCQVKSELRSLLLPPLRELAERVRNQ
jgi:hemoglobin